MAMSLTASMVMASSDLSLSMASHSSLHLRLPLSHLVPLPTDSRTKLQSSTYFRNRYTLMRFSAISLAIVRFHLSMAMRAITPVR